MKLTNFGRDEHKMVTAAMIAACKKVADEFGVDFAGGGGTLGQRQGAIKIMVSLRADGANPSGAQAEFARYASMIGAKPEWFGCAFVHKRAAFTVTGININAPKFPILAARTYDGTTFRFPVASIRTFLGAGS